MLEPPEESPAASAPALAFPRALAGAAACALASAAARAWPVLWGPGLGDSDPWRHIRWAQLLRADIPGALREWPQWTILHQSGVDLWWAFHRLLVPFTFGDLERGARWAALILGSLAHAGAAFALLRRSPRGWLAFGALLGLAPHAFVRACSLRPSPLTAGLMALFVWALLERRALWAFAFAYLHGLLHFSAPVELLPLAIFAGSCLVLERRLPLALIAAAVAGLGLGIVSRPDPLSYIQVALSVGRIPIAGASLGLGVELTPAEPLSLLLGLPLHALFLAAAAGLLRPWRAKALTPEELFPVVAAAALLVLGLRVRRFLEYAEVMEAIAIAQWAARRALGRWRLAFALVPLGILAMARIAYERAAAAPAAWMAGAAQALKAEVAPGALVFHDTWESWAYLFFHDPTHRYVVGADPTCFWLVDPRRFRLWRSLSERGEACDGPEESCPGADSPRAVEAALREFGAAAVVLTDVERRPALRSVLASAPDRFELLYRGDGPAAGLEVYRVVPRARAPSP